MLYTSLSQTDVNSLLRPAREQLTLRMLQPPMQRNEGDLRLDNIRHMYPIIDLMVPRNVFDNSSRFEAWCAGWMSSPSKMRFSVITCIGWALLGRKLSESVLPHALKASSSLRSLLHVARKLRDLQRLPLAWWDDAENPLIDDKIETM